MLGIILSVGYFRQAGIPAVFRKAFLANKFDLSASAELRGFPARECLGVRLPMSSVGERGVPQKLALSGWQIPGGEPEENPQ